MELIDDLESEMLLDCESSNEEIILLDIGRHGGQVVRGHLLVIGQPGPCGLGVIVFNLIFSFI